jgi:asparagine synthase (glutamine-hydrolysing)
MCGIFAVIGKYDKEEVVDSCKKLRPRGPDDSKYLALDNVFLGFHRLKIMDMGDSGNQPFDIDDVLLICNGEIYNYLDLKTKYNIKTTGNSDCEIIIHLYRKIGIINTVKQLDGVFAFFLYDKRYKQFFVARDYLGVRPLFIGHSPDCITFSSEMKAIECDEVKPFPPGHCLVDYSLQSYFNIRNVLKQITDKDEMTHCDLVRYFLDRAVEKRMMSERPIGCFLSGGLDSSLICALVQKRSSQPIHTFSIGMEGSHDLVYARRVAEMLGTHHHEVLFNITDAFYSLDELIRTIESYDVTTIRASLPQYLLSKYIRDDTDVTVVFSGEGADEHFAGYKYLQYAANENVLDKELFSLLHNLYQFDVLRTDRTTAACGLEVRVPFLDKHFVKYSMSIPTKYKMVNTDRMEKFLLRKAFDNPTDPYIPPDVLWRRKDAFSDSVGANLRTGLMDKIDNIITPDQFKKEKDLYKHNPPMTREALYYRKIFEKYYPGKAGVITKYWMPNSGWFEETFVDPSARTLPSVV